ncbi:hypothetical protein [Novosphingobium album (ex Hu et al. 2023)]|uniref:Uncharacterized protein n=1 Tax=Novosphingobium album (ex Hu et al. 2023) TaxID=2930093 RepID=A0ABT0B0W2_9SPHN|nr:hypothetical protein [Novosphingobium album (ex Hu et al. 2023)]MCJ2178662.1 hypothetical protein [Novosphingobium album (ex Hu et al. 2023)]
MSGFDFDRFLGGGLPAEVFDHRSHLAAAYEALRRYPFLEACRVVRECIITLATGAGAPQKYNETITLAAMALVAERMDDESGFEAFTAANADLLDRGFLDAYYSPARLSSPRARGTFLMPDRIPISHTAGASDTHLETSQ